MAREIVPKLRPKMYTAYGYRFKSNNDHLLGVVGQTHTLDEWIGIVFPKDADKARQFFDGYTDKQIMAYIMDMYGLRIEVRTDG